jgi:hypothetical protein
MAKIAFGDFMNNLVDGSIMKIQWQEAKKKPETQLLKFDKYFKKWIEINCVDFHPDSIDLLQHYNKDSMFYREDENRELIKMFHDDLRAKK